MRGNPASGEQNSARKNRLPPRGAHHDRRPLYEVAGAGTPAPVRTAEGLVGRVSEVGYTQSQVVLLGDPDCRVAVELEETLDHGIIAPSSSSPLDNTLVDVLYLSRGSSLKAGQRVWTSGLVSASKLTVTGWVSLGARQRGRLTIGSS